MKNNRYIVDPKYTSARLPESAYTKAKSITSKWSVLKKQTGSLIGNVDPIYNLKIKEFVWPSNPLNLDGESLFAVISSANLLYRLLCLYKATVESYGPDGYKLVWTVSLKHKETGETLMFGEWKGGSNMWTRFHSHEELPESFNKDLLELLNFLCSTKVPHPYDGCVAGSVA
jgi:hypothetical protein